MSIKYVKVANSSDIPAKIGHSVRAADLDIAIFRHKDKLYAFRDRCPHQGAPLSDGYVQDGCLVCVYHGWKFNLEDGSFVNNSTLKLKSYSVKEENGKILIGVTE